MQELISCISLWQVVIDGKELVLARCTTNTLGLEERQLHLISEPGQPPQYRLRQHKNESV